MLKWLKKLLGIEKSVLLVDDNQDIQQELGKFLQRHYHVYMAQTVEEAKQQIPEKEFDYAILDLKLDTPSELGGVEVWRYLRDVKPSVKVIILSAYTFEQTHEEFKKALVRQDNVDDILLAVENNYISKGEYLKYDTYIDAVSAKLAEF